MSELKIINKQIRVLQKKLDPLYKKQGKIEKERDTKNKSKLVGKCFKTRSLYNSSANSFWTYIKVTGINEFGVDTVFCEKEPNGRVTIDTEVHNENILKAKNYKPISDKIFEKHFNLIIKEVRKIANLWEKKQ